MLVVKNISIASALLTGAAQHALAAPMASSDLVLRSGTGVATDAVLEGRTLDIEETALEERKVNGKKLLHGAARVGKGLLKILLRDPESGEVFELSEREINDLMERDDGEIEIEGRDLEERKINRKKLLRGAGKVGKGLLKLLLRDEELEERDFDCEIEERGLEFGHQLEQRDFDYDLEERELEERKINRKKLLQGAGKVGKGLLKLLLREGDIENHDIQLDERDLEYIFARYLQDDE